MKKVNIFDEDKINYAKLKSYLDKKYKKDPLKDHMLYDFKASNWGYQNGRIVKVDYSCHKFIDKRRKFYG